MDNRILTSALLGGQQPQPSADVAVPLLVVEPALLLPALLHERSIAARADVRTCRIPPVPTEPQSWDSPTAAGDGTRGARAHRTTVISLDSASCRPLRVVLVEGRDEGKPGGLHDIRGRRPDRNPAARQLHLELDLSDSLAARAD
jgi:hypothetical protein